jgi:hypothetical protein
MARYSSSFLVIALTSILLSGCATGLDGETVIGRPGSPAWFRTASAETKLHYFTTICNGYGFKIDTPQMSQCIQNETLNAKNSQGIVCSKIGNNIICN